MLPTIFGKNQRDGQTDDGQQTGFDHYSSLEPLAQVS